MGALLNTSIITSPEEHFICPKIPAYVNILSKIRPNFVPVSYKRIGVNIQEHDKVFLKNGRRRLVNNKIITKGSSRIRNVIITRDYNIAGNFDESANRVVRGSKAPCTRFPAIRTTQVVRIPEGVFPLEDLSFKL